LARKSDESFKAQRFERVYAGGAAGRDDAGGDRGREQRGGSGDEDEWIGDDAQEFRSS